MTPKLRATLYGPITVIVSLSLSSQVVASPLAGQSTASPCAAWLNKTVAKMKKLPEGRWRDAIVAALGEGSCSAVPEALRNASREAGRSRKPSHRDRLLTDAAVTILGPACAVPDPSQDSRSLARVCPLPAREEFALPDSVFRDIRAVDYALIDSLATSLLSAKAYDAVAQRLMLNFLLSATLLGEHRNGEGARPSPPALPPARRGNDGPK